MSSASSTARWIDCTVDSMFTTTPFFRPRDGCEPTPSTSMPPSGLTSPTSATTFEVPMSSPTMRPLPDRLAMVAVSVVVVAAGDRRGASPADGESVRVSHVDVRDVVRALCHELRRRRDEAIEALVDLLAAEPHGDAVREIEFPRAARVVAQRREAQARFGEPPLRCEVALRDGGLGAIRTGELRKLGRHVTQVAREQFAARVEQAALAPTRGGYLLGYDDAQSMRPRALHGDRVHPRNRRDGLAHGREIDADESDVVNAFFHGALHVRRRDTLESSGDGNRFDR